jgi:RND superfamily putative drug exporter
MDVGRRKWLVIALWVIIIAASVPAVLRYSNYISYSTSSSALSHTESARAQALLNTAEPQNESLVLVVTSPQGANESLLANKTLQFQAALKDQHIQNLTNTVSAFSEYAHFIDTLLGNRTQLLRQAYGNFSNASLAVYSFPAQFLHEWGATGYTSVSQALKLANYTGTPFESAFARALNTTLAIDPKAPPTLIVQNSTEIAVYTLGIKNPYYYASLKYLNVTDYRSTLYGFSLLINDTFFHVSQMLLQAAIEPGDPGVNYVTMYGLMGAPSFITGGLVNGNRTVYLVQVYFGVPSGYIGKGDTTPSELATPQIRALAQKYFGDNAQLTGDGAIVYDTQKATAGAGAVFAFTFIFLAIAVAITLRSYIAPLMALLIVSVSTVLGYVSIYLTGLLIVHVNFIVTYTLTAVLLGVSTDYLVFLLHRYRQELREGLNESEALRKAMSTSGKAILISGLTVAASLGTFGFISDLRSWGPVLFLGVMLTVAAELTLLPAITAVIGPRIFIGKAVKSSTDDYRKSRFYAAAKLSVSRRAIIVGIIVLIAIPAVYAWFTLPTSYNFNEGLPTGLQSVKALNTLQESFGANLLYPNFVIVNLTGQTYSPNGTLTPDALAQLKSYYSMIASTNGVAKVLGPDPANTSAPTAQIASSFVFDHGLHAYYLFYVDYSPYSTQAISVVKSLRSDHSLLVGGLTSSVIDQQDYNRVVYSELEVLIVLAIAIIIGVSFRSLKYPLIALSGVFISITWTTALLYLIVNTVFHEQLLYLIPLILFIILMSLGNDYTVFIISRVKEYQQTEGFVQGILRGMSGSASVVTSLGIILAVSLGSLGLAPISFLRQLGLAFVISLLLDTFVIRTFYFPAMIALLREGRQNVDQKSKQK